VRQKQPITTTSESSSLRVDRRNRIEKYPDTLPANQTARKALPPIIPKVAVARWRTARVIVSLILRSSSSAIANDVSSAVHRIVKCGMRNLRPSCDYHGITIAAVSRLSTGSASVASTQRRFGEFITPWF